MPVRSDAEPTVSLMDDDEDASRSPRSIRRRPWGSCWAASCPAARVLQALLDAIRSDPVMKGVPEGYQLQAVLDWSSPWDGHVLDLARWLRDPTLPDNAPGVWNAQQWAAHYAGLAAADEHADDGGGPAGLWALGAEGLMPHVLRERPGDDGRAIAVCGKRGVPTLLVDQRFGPCRACMKSLLRRGIEAAEAALDPDW